MPNRNDGLTAEDRLKLRIGALLFEIAALEQQVAEKDALLRQLTTGPHGPISPA